MNGPRDRKFRIIDRMNAFSRTIALAAITAACLAGAACERDVAPPANPHALPSQGLLRYDGDGFSLLVPEGARFLDEPAAAPATARVRIVGPEVAVRPAEENWVLSGPAYVLDVATYENNEAVPLREWVEGNAIDPDALAPPTLEDATVAGEPAVLVTTFGGDSWIRTYYIGRGNRVVGLRFWDVPPANSPIAPVQRDVYALILGSFRWD